MTASVHFHRSAGSADLAAHAVRDRASASTAPPAPTDDTADASNKARGTDSAPASDDDSSPDFHSVLKKYHSQSSDSSSSDDDDDSDAIDDSSPDSSKKSDPARTLTVPVHVLQAFHEVLPLLAQNPFLATPETQPSMYTADAQSESSAPASEPSGSAAPPSDPQKPAAAPQVETSDAPPPPSSAPVAFAAKLTPDAGDSAAPVQNTEPAAANPAPQKQPAASSVASDDADASAKATTDAVIEKAVKIDPPAPAGPPQADGPSTTAASIHKDAPAQNVTAASRMEPLVEAPAAPASANHDITVRIHDGADRAMNVRFLDRGGEIHVSVRTADADAAQTLRGGLSDFVSRMDHAGIRAEVWRPGADASASQNNSQSFSEQREQKRNPSQAQEREDNDPQRNKPQWVEALEKAGHQAA